VHITPAANPVHIWHTVHTVATPTPCALATRTVTPRDHGRGAPATTNELEHQRAHLRKSI